MSFDALLAAVPLLLLMLIIFTYLVQGYAPEGTALDPEALFHRFLPPHNSQPGFDPFGPVERLLGAVFRNRGNLSLLAVPTFLWFSTRLFGSMRNSLNFVYDVASRPTESHGIVGNYLRSKARDASLAMVIVVLSLANTVLSAGLSLLRARSEAAAVGHELLVGALGQAITEGFAFLFSIALFLLVYRFASPRRLSFPSVLIASVFAAVGFEIAKRLYGIYLTRTVLPTSAVGSAQLGAVVLFVIWVHYMALVFLLGGVVAERWEARRLQTRQWVIVG